MTWLTLRQFRAQLITVAIALVAIGAVLLYTGPHLLHIYHSSGVQSCNAQRHGDCGSLIDEFTSHYSRLQHVGELIIVLPALIGAFWGAPLLAREVESGTYRVAFTQSVTRTRWLTMKVGLIGTASVLTALAFTTMIAWWASPLDAVSGNRLDPGQFSQRGIVPLAYALFAFALGLVAGALLRKVIPAMAVALGGFFAIRIVIQELVRGHVFSAPVSVTAPPFSNSPLGPNSWVVSSSMIDSAGRTIGSPKNYFQSHCGLTPNDYTKQNLDACTTRLGIHDLLKIQPANRYWPLQFWEAGVFCALAIVCIALTYWWVRRRVM